MSIHVALYKRTTLQSKWSILRTDFTEKGLIQFILARIKKRVFDPIQKRLFLQKTKSSLFWVNHHSYSYFAHGYNNTWTNERSVEIPYFQALLSSYQSKNILEIGHTYTHYFPSPHLIIDKYEKSAGVRNTDVLDFKSRKKFNLIFSISTFEHIGWHETERDSSKAVRALLHLQKMLSSNGELVFSFPIGVNPSLDALLKNDKRVPLKTKLFLRRKNWFNEWEQAEYIEVKNVHYNSPYPHANAICIATLTRS